MKKLTAIFLVLMVLLTGCARESAYRSIGAENVTMTISGVTPGGATVTIQDSNKDPFVYGSWFQIEREKDEEFWIVRKRPRKWGKSGAFPNGIEYRVKGKKQAEAYAKAIGGTLIGPEKKEGTK